MNYSPWSHIRSLSTMFPGASIVGDWRLSKIFETVDEWRHDRNYSDSNQWFSSALYWPRVGHFSRHFSVIYSRLCYYVQEAVKEVRGFSLDESFWNEFKVPSFLQISRSSAISLNQEEFKISLDLDLLQALKVLASKLQIFTFLLILCWKTCRLFLLGLTKNIFSNSPTYVLPKKLRLDSLLCCRNKNT